MALEDTYRIIHCKQYNSERQISSQWWEVECYKKKWWSFGKRWFTETQELFSSGGPFDVPLKFTSESDAFNYIGRVSQKIPKDTVIREPVKSFI